MITVQRLSNIQAQFQNLDTKIVPFENSHITKYIYKKLIKLQSLSIIFNILSILVSLSTFDTYHLKNELIDFTDDDVVQFKMIFLMLSSFCVFISIGLEILINRNELKYKLYKGKDKKECKFFGKNNIKKLLINILILLIHPNYIFEFVNIINEGNYIKIFNSNAGDFVIYHLNDFFVLGNLCKTVFIFVYLFKNVGYNSDVSDRIW